ncbi:MAG: hypothetical protein LUH03_08400 [Oscillospiraceae bacterium]|nr:hypothetical protein [Oscillospiraceae bacterium]
MKKEYIAPDLYYEAYILSQSIASCSEKGQILADEWGQAGYFLDSESCDEVWIDGYEGYCYWSGSDMTLFLS